MARLCPSPSEILGRRLQRCLAKPARLKVVEEGIWTVGQAARFMLADRVKEEITDGTPVAAEASLYADLLGAALQEVNWDEIAGHWLDNLED